ncbi:MAG: hypothetical protein ACJ74W_13245 [Pyrinomonadaceae bacterium]
MSIRPLTFHPLLTLALSLAGASLYAIYATLHFSGDKLANQYLYVVPIVVPFVAFLCDRAARFRQLTAVQLAIDALVVGTAMWRVFGNVPYISGHALFLTYALLSTNRRVAQITAALVLLETIYLKLFVWHDVVTPLSGIILGTLVALIARRYHGTNPINLH